MTQEEKAKRYDEALERAKNTIEVNQTIPDIVECVESLFPELKEPEDERIRKVLVDYFKSYKKQSTCGAETFNGIPTDNIIAWLEKQKGIKEYGYNAILEVNGIVRDINFIDFDTTGTSMQIPLENHTLKSGDKVKVTINKFEKQGEQKSTIEMKSVEESLGIDSDTYNNIVDECIYGEQKPAWSEEDEKRLSDVITQLKAASNIIVDDEIDDSIAFVKSLKDRAQPQREWTIHDEEELRIVLNTLREVGQNDSAHWLKNVCLIPQNTWKPSEEQMEALESATENCAYSEYQDCLRELIGQLKKLRED